MSLSLRALARALLLVPALALLGASAALAQGQPNREAPDVPAETEASDAAAAEGPHGGLSLDDERPLPDYDGRPDPGPTPGQKALWVPRVLLAPAYVVNEFVLRRPLEFIAIRAEQSHFGPKVANALTFGTGGRVGVIPTAFFDFGLRPSIGLSFWSNDLPTDNDRLRVHLATGGKDWWLASVTQRFSLTNRGSGNAAFRDTHLALRFRFHQRPDHLVNGPRPSGAALYHAYGRTDLSGGGGVEVRLGQLDGVRVDVDGARHRYFDGDGSVRRADREVTEGIFAAGSAISAAPLNDYRIVRTNVELQLDTRSEDATEAGDGARLVVGGGLSHGTYIESTHPGFASRTSLVRPDLDDEGFDFARTYARGGLFWDVNDLRRVLSLSTEVEMASALGDSVIPLDELPRLGGGEGLRSHYVGTFRGETTTVTTLQWSYPVWMQVDGFMYAAVGQAFGENFSGFDVGSFASGYGFGLRSSGDRDSAFEMHLALGTTPFDADSFGIDSVRFAVGASRGF